MDTGSTISSSDPSLRATAHSNHHTEPDGTMAKRTWRDNLDFFVIGTGIVLGLAVSLYFDKAF